MAAEHGGRRSLVDRTPNTVVYTSAQARYLDWAIDILVYTVVLNVFEEFVDGVVIESFTVSVLTAVLLKVMLVLLVQAEHRVHHYVQEKESAVWTAVGAVAIFAILFGGKLLILEVVDLVFGDDVDLGHFVEVVVLILAMMITRRILNRVFRRLGAPAAE